MTLDSQIGIGVYTTTHKGIGGRIRDSPEDFKVTEVLSEAAQKMISAGGSYAVYVLKKQGIDTNHALSDLRRHNGVRLKALGLKDASAVTAQFVCSTSTGKAMQNYSSARYSVEHVGDAKRPLSKGDMVANRFAVRIKDSGDVSSFSEYDKILNFYGYQRFGSKRPITHLVGRAIIHRDFEKAVDILSTLDGQSQELDYEKRLDLLPKWMDIERAVLNKMIQSGDALLSLRAAPISMRRFYVHAYQSYIFNCTLSLAFSDGVDLFSVQDGDVCFDSHGKIGKYLKGLDQRLAVPFVGYAYYKKTRFARYISQILHQEEVAPGDFFIKEMDEASSEGGFRQAAVECKDCSVRGDVAEFTLSRGSFATMVLREMIKPANPVAAGF
ncbi:MAG: tRNA pseudouridine(13) synthase TruD [Nitrosopumilus sp. B06]|nr:MAG: tRNA pseudouridine(13) synthase TruD [Nitrosopumilus sp. B06]